MVYGTLGIGDSFGGRALLSEADFVDDGENAGKKYLGPARLSVVLKYLENTMFLMLN